MNKTKKIKTLFLVALTSLTVSCITVDPELPASKRIIHVDVVALDHDIQFNRFGSHDPYGMIYALKRDVVSSDGSDSLLPGRVKLRSDKRARPLALRANAGDILEVSFTNLLSVNRPAKDANDIAEPETEGSRIPIDAATKIPDANPLGLEECGSKPNARPHGDSPATRCASIAISGIPLASTEDAHDPIKTGLQGIAPSAEKLVTYRWQMPDKPETTYLFTSLSAPSGGEGDGGSLVHGLFGTLTIEPKDSRWYQSAVKAKDLELAVAQAKKSNTKCAFQALPDSKAYLNYEAVDDDCNPVLNLLKQDENKPGHFELIASPLDAIIVDKGTNRVFREFTATFHDELKTVYRPEFQALATNDKQLAGVGDGFAINYGASGMGTILMANRLGIGPAKKCVDCLYEEFFLQSWANGDPALLASYENDPSNVHHSYLGDPVRFRNSHAGPKETHVFHLHAHQWESSQSGYTNYLDSQTIAPFQSHAYSIAYDASGNRNLTPGDSIFHCHLYPHFAQGMWSLWRVHDVFENGNRRLPDGELGPGTDPETGLVDGGTPIPAVVPLPGKAMAPDPTYPAQCKTGGIVSDSKTCERIDKPFPGYPFYIPGKAGHRAPQPPLDIVEDGGLGRHLVGDGDVMADRDFNGGATLEKQLANADMTAHLKKVNLTLLKEEGTALEKAAMVFHENPHGYKSKTPEGNSSFFKVNGHKAQHGAPFADPCGLDPEASIRRYRASAIDLDILTNEHGWHDPQSRINVLDKTLLEDPERYSKNKMTKDVEPFFFRVESGECVEFFHTNRSGKDIRRDDFQVATPTDIIGQHIHLVKFDVTSSDGSANGFNYQDGTFSHEAIKELAEASKFGEVKDFLGNLQPVPKPKIKDGKPVYQTTIQRWWADSHEHKDGDGTLGTVFTHDHFAPSSIQHHGFYNAMLVEPKGSIWRTPDGTDMKTGIRIDEYGNELHVAHASKDTPCKAPLFDNRPCVESYAVGSRGAVVTSGVTLPKVQEKHPDTREFAIAIADFALLYDKNQQAGDPMPEGMIGNVSQQVADYFADIRQKYGYPVDPPELPEAISTHHHNPYLVNYKHEPIPLRIGERSRENGRNKDFSQLLPQLSDCQGSDKALFEPDNKASTWCDPSDLAYVFSSYAPHGDPFLKPFRAYEGDRVQFRMVQGAQEVQHSFTVHGLNWRREAKNHQAPFVNAQEIGISEHFEMDVTSLPNVSQGLTTSDNLFHFGTQDDLWNGSWGLLRAFDGPKAYDPVRCEDDKGVLKVEGIAIGSNLNKDALTKAHCTLTSVGQAPEKSCPDGGRIDDSCALAALPNNQDGKIVSRKPDGSENVNEFVDVCPEQNSKGKPIAKYAFQVEAWQVKDLAGQSLFYDAQNGIHDPDALVFITKENKEALQHAKAQNKPAVIEPLVLRVPTDSCVEVKLTNHLPRALPDGKGDAFMPRITSLNVESDQSQHQVKPSSAVSIHPQLVAYNPTYGDGAVVGFNDPSNALAYPNDMPVSYYWYTGQIEGLNRTGAGETLIKRAHTKPTVAALTSYGDVIGQGSHGLIGALIIEPEGSEVYFADGFIKDASGFHGSHWSYPKKDDANGATASPGLSSVVVDTATHTYNREFVVFYQDGLNLQASNGSVPDCRICDDSYDLGEKAVNYHSPMFWARLGLSPKTNEEDRDDNNLNDTVFPANFFDPSFRPLPFSDFQAKAGEKLRFFVLQPSGRGRQRTFQVYGHTFNDDIPHYGSPWNRLIAPGIAHVAEVEKALPGTWLYRDGPQHIFAGGSWGRLVVE